MRRRPVPLACCLTFAGAAPLAAQVPEDSLPTRAGRWAAEGGVGSDASSLSALRFVGPRSALGFAALFAFQRAGEAAGGAFQSRGFSNASFGAAAGYRRYARPRDRLTGFAGAGALLTYARASSGSASTVLGLGGYGELGAAYLVARRLSINLSTQVRVLRQSTRLERVTDQDDGSFIDAATSTGWSARAGGVGVSATLFF